MKKLIELWNKETPRLARALQYVFGSIAVCVAALFVFWGNIPQEFKAVVSPSIMQYIVYVGGIAAFGTALLQFTTKKSV